MLDILLFILLGTAIGILLGLLPGIHPNMIVLGIPFLAAANIPAPCLLAFLAALGVSNVITDFIPSMLLGMPDENALSVMPGQRMLMAGRGYSAVTLAVCGALGGVVIASLLFPLLVVSIPFLYGAVRPVIHVILVIIVLAMIMSNGKKLAALVVALSAGLVGIVISRTDINSVMVLFPIFTGLFGFSSLILQARSGVSPPAQKTSPQAVSRKTINRSVVLGSLGGIMSGFLPGVGTSEIAGLATIDKNEKSFIVTSGAIAAANILVSIMSLWLIGKARSGIAVVAQNISDVGFSDVLAAIAAGMVAAGIAGLLVPFMARKFLSRIGRMNYSVVSTAVMSLLALLVVFFTGLQGVVLLTACTALGIYAGLAGVRRGLLMCVLIVPTIIFYAF